MVKILVLLVILAIIAGIFWLMRGSGVQRLEQLSHRHKPKHPEVEDEFVGMSGKQKALAKLRHSGQFWGVEIVQEGCKASMALAGKHFAFEEAPALPLEGCEARICTCQYKGLKEHRRTHRRTQKDRRDSLRFDTGKADRRSIKDRRRRFDQWKGRS
jgi:hypothetical protein